MTYCRISLKAVQLAFLQQQSTQHLNLAVSDFFAFFSAISHSKKQTDNKVESIDWQPMLQHYT